MKKFFCFVIILLAIINGMCFNSISEQANYTQYQHDTIGFYVQELIYYFSPVIEILNDKIINEQALLESEISLYFEYLRTFYQLEIIGYLHLSAAYTEIPLYKEIFNQYKNEAIEKQQQVEFLYSNWNEGVDPDIHATLYKLCLQIEEDIEKYNFE